MLTISPRPLYYYTVHIVSECPRLWHYDENLEICRPGIEHVDLKCSGDLIQVDFKNIIFDKKNRITVNK